MCAVADQLQAVALSAADSAAKKAAEHFTDRVLNGLSDMLATQFEQARAHMKLTFQRYLENAYKRYNKVKTLATGNEPCPIVGAGNIYVTMDVQYRDTVVDTSDVEPLLALSNNLLILGTGGAGKSMLMRYLLLSTIDHGNRIPILIELRKFSNQGVGALSLMDLAYGCMEEFNVSLPRAQFEYSLEHGKYLFLLDGFDEIKEELAKSAAANIQAFSAKYPNNAFIMTSRPSRDFSILETFTAVESTLLTKAQAVELARKLWEKGEKLEEFCRQLDDGLFEQHQDFAENPLLLTMMLLTFADNNAIPEHLSDFYKRAYDALYRAHDCRNKGIYKREFCCGELDEGVFQSIFARFCFHTYFDEEYEFTEARILSRLEAATQKAGVPTKAADYLRDLMNAVCLIVQDGNVYRFSHRSFQEYFAARYTADSLTDAQQQEFFYKLLSKKLYWNMRAYFNLLFQLEPERFGPNILERGVRELYEESAKSEYPDPALIRLMYSEVEAELEDDKVKIYYTIRTNIYCNSYSLYTNHIKKLSSGSETYFSGETWEQSAKAYMEYLSSVSPHISGIESPDELVDGYQFDLDAIDASPLLTTEEKHRCYGSTFYYHNIHDQRASMGAWLDELAAKRRALEEESDFSDLLASL